MHDEPVKRFGVVLLLGMVACTKPNPVVCCTSPADCSSLGLNETSRECSDGFACLDHKCATPVDAAPIDTPTTCTTNAECASPAPFCSNNGICVACLASSDCAATAPVCDDDGACRGCEADGECSSGVCDTPTGTCVDTSMVRYAAPSGAGTECTQSTPCAIAQAFSSADATHPRVKLAAGTYSASITVANKSVTVHGDGATVNATAGARTFEINDGASVRFIGLSVGNANTGANPTIGCETVTADAPVPEIVLDHANVDTASGYAVFGYPCTVTITNSRITGHDPNQYLMLIVGTTAALIDRTIIDGGNAILAEGPGSVVRITNSIIRNMNGPDGAFAGSRLFATVPGSMFVSFSTIVNSHVKCFTGAPKCAGGSEAGSCIDNSIILNSGGPADTVEGMCQVSHSIVLPQSTTLSGSGNQLGVSPMLASPSTGDYHLLPGSPAIDQADPAATNDIDFDGIMRPQGDGKDIGAFEYKPR